MSNNYVIRWKSKVNGRAGRGTKIFEKEEAERLAEELNHEYPQIHHEVVEIDPVPDQPQEQPAGQRPLSSEVPLLSVA